MSDWEAAISQSMQLSGPTGTMKACDGHLTILT